MTPQEEARANAIVEILQRAWEAAIAQYADVKVELAIAKLRIKELEDAKTTCEPQS